MVELLSIQQAMKELQIEEEQLKDLIRTKEIRYVLDNNRVKIPKPALMAVKIHKMSSHTSQIQMQTSTRKLKATQEKDHVSLERAMDILKVDRATLQTLISSQRLRVLEIDGSQRVPLSAIDALKIQMPKNPAKESTSRMQKQKRKRSTKRKY